jgi:hypothetical protein
MYPISRDFTAFNWDWLTDEDPDPFIMAMNGKSAILGEPYILPDPDEPQEVADAEFWASYFAGSVCPGDDAYEPVSDILYPVIDSIDRIQILSSNTRIESKENETRVVGMLSASFYWRDVMKNLLPSGRGVVVVVDNPCTASFSYQIT